MPYRAREGPIGEWRNPILESLSHLFKKQGASFLYGPGHAQAVERAVLEALQVSEAPGLDVPLLRCAALLHDAGFACRTENWSIDCFEHLAAGRQLVLEILARNSWFSDFPERIDQVLYLVQHHDDTTYSFPTATQQGYPYLSPGAQQPNRLSTALAILQEADARVHVSDDCILEAMREWQARGVPLFAGHSAPLETWRWMDSVMGNVRLVAKRAVVDARTSNGRHAAIAAYQRLEDYVREQCRLAGLSYTTEACPPTMREASIARLAGKTFDLEIVAFYAWDELEQALRSASLLYDKTIHPYRQAKIQLKLGDLDALSPMALYVLHNRLEEVLELHDALMATYALGIWDLPGLLEFRYNSPKIQPLAPPVVEDYIETTCPGHPRLLGLVDGLHRCTAARSAVLSRVRTVVASEVPYPLVPLPVRWSEVQVYQGHQPLSNHKKRRFRYQTLADFPLGVYPTSVPVTEENFQYFFYRDWRVLGSRGRRDFGEFESKRAR